MFVKATFRYPENFTHRAKTTKKIIYLFYILYCNYFYEIFLCPHFYGKLFFFFSKEKLVTQFGKSGFIMEKNIYGTYLSLIMISK
jgi:hypothetical protein